MSELKAIESATAVIENVHMVYRKSEADKVIAELKASEDVLVTDNRNLLDKVKKLENLLRENAEHFQRNEARINLLNVWNTYKILSNTYKELKFTKRALWLSRALSANHAANFCYYIAHYGKLNKVKKIYQDQDKWDKIEEICIKKAEEYK